MILASQRPVRFQPLAGILQRFAIALDRRKHKFLAVSQGTVGIRQGLPFARHSSSYNATISLPSGVEELKDSPICSRRFQYKISIVLESHVHEVECLGVAGYRFQHKGFVLGE